MRRRQRRAHGQRGRADNTGVGALALTANTDGGNNIAIGSRALEHNTTGSNNIAIGASRPRRRLWTATQHSHRP
jgi:hypothetical protein